MSTRDSLCRSLLGAVLLVALHAPGAATSARPLDGVRAEITRLVPSDAFVFVQIESLERVQAALERLAEDVDLPFGDVDLSALLAALVPGDVELIDRTQPIAVALSLPARGGDEPVPTFILPVIDAERFQASLTRASDAAPIAGVGAYLGVPLGSTYPRGGATPSVAASVSAGAIAVRIDVATLVGRLRSEIAAALATGAGVGAGVDVASAAVGLDAAALRAALAEGLLGALDAIETVELALDIEGTTVDLYGSVEVFAGTALDGWSDERPRDASRLAGFLSTSAPFQAALSADLARLSSRLEPLVDALLARHEAEVRDGVRAQMRAWQALYASLGDGMALSVGNGPEGCELAYFFATDDAPALARRYGRMVEEQVRAGAGLALSGPVAATVAGVAVSRYTIGFDAPSQAGVGGARDGSVDVFEALRAVYGARGVRLSLAATEGALVLVVGGDDVVARAVGSLAQGAQPVAPALAGALERVRGASPSFAVAIPPQAFFPAGDSRASGAPLVLYGAIGGRLWYGGLRFDVAGR